MIWVQDPNIIWLYEVMVSKTKIFFIMEYVKGSELFDRVFKKGILKEEVVRK